ncbi:hypothetical protein JZO86_14360 [Enterococcus ureasiticus]|uniref:hypothetical protein n=1 Tax=Enterococcus ureasiticus TaxID=903984 RepID=UPI001A8FF0E3|nr:hypothetical protein [Enterococcus ureasiticus]MBO0474882.1 hypothetical protein [Enterococcus ureasiticus]
MNLIKKAGLLLLAILFCVGILGLLFYLTYVVKNYKISLAVTAVFVVVLLVFMRLSKKKSRY